MDPTIINNNEEYFIHQISTACLAQFSYYIESNKEAVVIDPIRESDAYLELLKQRGATLKYILLTHFHADFVSGHVELNKHTGAQIVFGPTAQTDFEALIAEDGQVLPLGNVFIKVIHTPGHTLESVCYLLSDSKETPKAVFTGDCIFLGDVGRPDLAVKSHLSEKDLAGLLYDSVQKIKALPDDVLLYPGHGAGSACGKNISSGLFCTVGKQKHNNYALSDHLSKDEFVEIVTANLPTPPQYFFFDVMLNKKGYDQVDSILEKSLKPIIPEEFFKLVNDKEIKVIDNRDFIVSIKGFVRGSYLISLKMQYAIWTATCFTPQQKLVIITDVGKEKESIIRLARVGYENVLGYVEGGFDAIAAYAEQNGLQDHLTKLIVPDLSQIKEVLEINEKEHNYEILDVREINEVATAGHLANAHIFPLSQFEKNIDSVLEELKEKSIGVHCKTGGRATLAASILAKYGVNNMTFLGGFNNMLEKQVPVVKDS